MLFPINLCVAPRTTSPTRACALCMLTERISDFLFRNTSDGVVWRKEEREERGERGERRERGERGGRERISPLQTVCFIYDVKTNASV